MNPHKAMKVEILCKLTLKMQPFLLLGKIQIVFDQDLHMGYLICIIGAKKLQDVKVNDFVALFTIGIFTIYHFFQNCKTLHYKMHS